MVNAGSVVVYSDQNVYAGWPANHGAWQWGDKFLVGFLRGRYRRKSMHNIVEPFEKVLARSTDGGESWSVEVPNSDFECHESSAPSAPPHFDMHEHIIRVCGVYDHGGDYCYEGGGFYKSCDMGKTWDGPYRFVGLERQLEDGDSICTARTRVHDGLLFLSRGQRNVWGQDSVFCARHDGERFVFVSTVLEDEARAVMPAVAEVGGRIVVAMRRRHSRRRLDGWIDAVYSDDCGLTWSRPIEVGLTGGRNGNPPALAATPDGRLVCCYGHRGSGSIMCAVSEDSGITWKSHVAVQGDKSHLDIGYPQLFMRSDGKPVVVYYWASADRPHQHILATRLEI